MFNAMRLRARTSTAWLAWAGALSLSACGSAPPAAPVPVLAPAQWDSWRSGDGSLRLPVVQELRWPAAWWTAFGDPVLDELAQRAVAASPDLRTAALRFAQSRVQVGVVTAQAGVHVNAGAGVTRQAQSQQGAATRMLDAIGGANRDQLAGMLSKPFNLYQAGFDASWEPDFWGRVRHAVEVADADADTQAALLVQARLSLMSELARHYLDYCNGQALIALAERDIATQQERLDLLRAKAAGGLVDQFDVDRQGADLAAIQAQLPPLMAQVAASQGQLELLVGERPGSLQPLLQRADGPDRWNLPDLGLGLPSEVAVRRPDVQAAQGRLRRAIANLGVARSELYPSFRLGARAGLESTRSGEFANWSSRTWSIGPSLDLPLFDRGRRQGVVQLRDLEQQEAAIQLHKTMLQAWRDIDDALNGYEAEVQQLARLREREDAAARAQAIADARYRHGTVDFTPILDAQRSLLQARRDRVSSEGRLKIRFVSLNKAIGLLPQS